MIFILNIYFKKENTNGNHHVMEDKLAYEDRNSRVIAAVGAEALKKFQTTNVLLIGLKGLGAEIGNWKFLCC